MLGAIVDRLAGRERIAGVPPVSAHRSAIFVVQVALGGLTVALSNSPWSVVVHWGTAMLLLAGLTALAPWPSSRGGAIALRHPPWAALLDGGAALAFVACAPDRS